MSKVVEEFKFFLCMINYLDKVFRYFCLFGGMNIYFCFGYWVEVVLGR